MKSNRFLLRREQVHAVDVIEVTMLIYDCKVFKSFSPVQAVPLHIWYDLYPYFRNQKLFQVSKSVPATHCTRK